MLQEVGGSPRQEWISGRVGGHARPRNGQAEVRRETGARGLSHGCRWRLRRRGSCASRRDQRLLEERPAVVGIAVPGMPAGSPGMEGAMKERYDVLTFDRAGRSRVYAK